MTQNEADQEAIAEGVVAGAMAWAVANLAEKYLVRTRGLRAAQIYFACVLLSVIGSLVLFVLGVTVGYGLVTIPAAGGIWLGACAVLLLWCFPVTYGLAVAEARYRRRTGRRGLQGRRIARYAARMFFRAF